MSDTSSGVKEMLSVAIVEIPPAYHYTCKHDNCQKLFNLPLHSHCGIMRTWNPSRHIRHKAVAASLGRGSWHMKEEIAPYTLPAEAQAQLMGLAAEADQLVLGEIHGTQEVPRLLLGLREPLAERGYRGLALEI